MRVLRRGGIGGEAGEADRGGGAGHADRHVCRRATGPLVASVRSKAVPSMMIFSSAPSVRLVTVKLSPVMV